MQVAHVLSFGEGGSKAVHRYVVIEQLWKLRNVTLNSASGDAYLLHLAQGNSIQ